MAIGLTVPWACMCASAGSANTPAGSLRVMTYNIRHAEGLDGKVDIDRIASVIHSARPDVVCLQEVDRNLPRTQHADLPALLAKKLHMNVVFEPNYHFDGGDYGNATLSRLEIVAHENFPLPHAGNHEPRGCLRTTLRIAGRNVDVLNTHLGLEPAERKQQALAILGILHEAPTLLAGDLNEEPGQDAAAALMARFTDTASPHGPTFPASVPQARIDFVLVSGPWNVLSSRVIATPETDVASDHLPYTADLQLPPLADKAADEGVYDNDDERVTEAIVEGK